MTFPTVIVEVGFSSPSTGTYLHLDDEQRGILDTNVLAPDDLWVDVTRWVTSVATRRGATRADGPVLRYEAGTATIVLRNEDRRFDPTNVAGPYVAGGVTQVEPMRAVRIRARYGGISYALWRGFADDWQVGYDSQKGTSYVTLTCSDAFSVFASYDRDAIGAVGAGEASGARIARILNSIGWSSTDRRLAGGDLTVQSTTLADNALTELLLTADSELGEFWMDPKGIATLRDRTAIQDDARSALSQATFGDLPNEGVTTTVNLATNPSLETNTSNGWGTIGTAPPTIARDGTRAMFGANSLKVTWGAGGVLPGVVYDVAGLTAGRVYTISVYVWVPSGAPEIHLIAQSEWGTGTDGLFDQWVRLSWTGTATSTTIGLGIWPVTTPAGGEFAWIDGMQFEEGASATTYVDGDQGNSEWDGVPHASTSRRLPELPYSDAVLTSDAQSIANLISIANAGGTAQVVEDAGSRTAYLTRTYQRHDLLMQFDALALRYAENLLARTSTPELRFSTLALDPLRDPDRLGPQALGREIGDRIRVVRRPPGGGAAIEREAWVRGIEHDFHKSTSRWKTTFVLQQAPTITTVSDTFTRTTSNGWGTSDTGHAWSVSGGTAADYSTTGSRGRMSVGAVASSRNTVVGPELVDVDVTTQIQVGVLAAGGFISAGLVGRWASSSMFYNARAEFNVGGAISLSLFRVDPGSTTLATAAVASTTHSTGASYSLRFRITGSTLRVKFWLTSSSEPAAWDITHADTSPLTAGGAVGCRSSLASGNSNALPVLIDFNDFDATSLYVWS